jgi:release factor glutamine methyltransferase
MSLRINELDDIRTKLLVAYERQPYEIKMDDIQLNVCKGVFPPNVAMSTPMLMQSLKNFEPYVALDMGCGTGILAIQMKLYGCERVIATDINPEAVACTRHNAKRNGANHIETVESDLFMSLPKGLIFDLIVFNQFYYPSDIDWFGPSWDGGAHIVTRFFDDAAKWLAPDGVILMSFADVAGAENDPAPIAMARGFSVEPQIYIENESGSERVYVMSKSDGRQMTTDD